MRRISLAVVLLAIGTLALASVPAVGAKAGWGDGTFAGTPMGQLIFGRMERAKQLRADLNVTADQRAEIKEVIVAHRREIGTAMKSLRGAKVDLRDLVLTDGSKEADIRAAANALGTEIGNAAVLAAELRDEIAPILTDDQHALIDEFIAANDSEVGQFMKEAGSR